MRNPWSTRGCCAVGGGELKTGNNLEGSGWVIEKSAQFRRIVVVPVRFEMDISRVKVKSFATCANLPQRHRGGVAV